MSGDTSTLSWRSMSPTSQSDSSDLSPTATVGRDSILPVKIIKVCFLSNSSNLGKNFKLVRCEEGWTVRVYSTVLYCTLLYSTVLCCTLLYSAVLYCTLLYSTVLCCTLLYGTFYFSLLHCSRLYSTILHCALMHYTILYFTFVYSLLYCTQMYFTAH